MAIKRGLLGSTRAVGAWQKHLSRIRRDPAGSRVLTGTVPRVLCARSRSTGRITVATTDEDAMLETLEGWLASEVVPARDGAGARRPLSPRDGGADAGVRAVRRDHPRGVRRSGALGVDLRADRRGDLAGVDVAHRRDQHPPDGGGARPPLRHRRAACALPPAPRGRRAARRSGAHRTRLRHRPAGGAHHRDACRRRVRAATARRCGSPTRTRGTVSRCS